MKITANPKTRYEKPSGIRKMTRGAYSFGRTIAWDGRFLTRISIDFDQEYVPQKSFRMLFSTSLAINWQDTPKYWSTPSGVQLFLKWPPLGHPLCRRVRKRWSFSVTNIILIGTLIDKVLQFDTAFKWLARPLLISKSPTFCNSLATWVEREWAGWEEVDVVEEEDKLRREAIHGKVNIQLSALFELDQSRRVSVEETMLLPPQRNRKLR